MFVFVTVHKPLTDPLCSLQVDLSSNRLGVKGGKAIAQGISLSSSLTQVLASVPYFRHSSAHHVGCVAHRSIYPAITSLGHGLMIVVDGKGHILWRESRLLLMRCAPVAPSQQRICGTMTSPVFLTSPEKQCICCVIVLSIFNSEMTPCTATH